MWPTFPGLGGLSVRRHLIYGWPHDSPSRVIIATCRPSLSKCLCLLACFPDCTLSQALGRRGENGNQPISILQPFWDADIQIYETRVQALLPLSPPHSCTPRSPVRACSQATRLWASSDPLEPVMAYWIIWHLFSLAKPFPSAEFWIFHFEK